MINYAKITTAEEFEQLGFNKLETIKERAKDIKNEYDYDMHVKTTHNSSQTAYSVYRTFHTMASDEILKKEYNNETDTFKQVLKSNIIFPDSNKLFNILSDNNVNYKILLSISKRLSNLKLLSQLNETMNDILDNKYTIDETNQKIDNIFKILVNKKILIETPKSKNIEQKLQIIKIIINKLSEKTNTDKNIETIVRKLNYYYSTNEYEIILTRLVQIVVFEKELYINHENSKVKIK